jgi:hypothetical protein
VALLIPTMFAAFGVEGFVDLVASGSVTVRMDGPRNVVDECIDYLDGGLC